MSNELHLTRQELDVVLSTMHVPVQRLDTTDISNLLWLSRNLGIQNRGHKHLPAARLLVRALLKEDRRVRTQKR